MRVSAVLLLALIACVGCASTSSIQNAPLHAGTGRTFDSDFDTVLAAARQATTEAGLAIEKTERVDEKNWIIIGKKGTSAFSWGELVRVAVTDDGPEKTTVRVYTKRKLATNVLAKGDYAHSILSNIELLLK